MAKKKTKIVAQMVPVEMLLNLLHIIQEEGALFVDIEITKGEKQDEVNFMLYDKYYDEYEEKEEPASPINFNDLI